MTHPGVAYLDNGAESSADQPYGIIHPKVKPKTRTISLEDPGTRDLRQACVQNLEADICRRFEPPVCTLKIRNKIFLAFAVWLGQCHKHQRILLCH